MAEISIKLPKVNLWMLTTAVLAVVLILGFSGFVKIPGITGRAVTEGGLTGEDAANKAINYINDNLIQTGEASFVSVREFDGLYEVTTSYQGREIPIYITQDGQWLFVSQPYDTSEQLQQGQPSGQQEFDAPDREKPNVKFFTMAFCPYGDQALEGLEPVYRLLGNKVDWAPHYVIYSDYRSGYPDYCWSEDNKYCSMHGIQELHQDVRELCAWKYLNHDLWWDFVLKIYDQCSAQNVDECWKSVAKEVGLDVSKIEDCYENEATDLLSEEKKLNEDYGVRGSPTVIINDEKYSGSRSSEGYKQAICSGFITEPDECSQQLSGSTGGSPSGGCA